MDTCATFAARDSDFVPCHLTVLDWSLHISQQLVLSRKISKGVSALHVQDLVHRRGAGMLFIAHFELTQPSALLVSYLLLATSEAHGVFADLEKAL